MVPASHLEARSFFSRYGNFCLTDAFAVGRMETSMAENEDDWIKKRAYALWEEEGQPHGKDAEHWEQARREYSAFALKPVRRAATKGAGTASSDGDPPSAEPGASRRAKKADKSTITKKSAPRRPKKSGDAPG